MGRNKINLLGRKFGRLTVIGETQEKYGTSYKWLCRCDCGTEKLVVGSQLTRGHTKSCGCNPAGGFSKTHGQSGTKLYWVWRDMKKRCGLETSKSYQYYGGKGVKVCEEWESDFEAFYGWMKRKGYRSGLVVDRIDPDGDYCPENCQLLTHSENSAKVADDKVRLRWRQRSLQW